MSIGLQGAENAASAIKDAWETVQLQTGETARIEIIAWMTDLAGTSKPWMWATADGLELIIARVFEQPAILDFVMLLQFHFFIRWGEAQLKFTELVDVLSWACAGQPSADAENSAVPVDLKVRMNVREDVQALLADNPWMVCLLLLRSYVRVYTQKVV